MFCDVFPSPYDLPEDTLRYSRRSHASFPNSFAIFPKIQCEFPEDLPDTLRSSKIPVMFQAPHALINYWWHSSSLVIFISANNHHAPLWSSYHKIFTNAFESCKMSYCLPNFLAVIPHHLQSSHNTSHLHTSVRIFLKGSAAGADALKYD